MLLWHVLSVCSSRSEGILVTHKPPLPAKGNFFPYLRYVPSNEATPGSKNFAAITVRARLHRLGLWLV